MRKGQVLDAVSRTLPSPAEEQAIPNQAVELSLQDSRDPGGAREQLQGPWWGLCAALAESAACFMVSCPRNSPSGGQSATVHLARPCHSGEPHLQTQQKPEAEPSLHRFKMLKFSDQTAFLTFIKNSLWLPLI